MRWQELCKAVAPVVRELLLKLVTQPDSGTCVNHVYREAAIHDLGELLSGVCNPSFWHGRTTHEACTDHRKAEEINPRILLHIFLHIYQIDNIQSMSNLLNQFAKDFKIVWLLPEDRCSTTTQGDAFHTTYWKVNQ